jgi:hypothetical protein
MLRARAPAGGGGIEDSIWVSEGPDDPVTPEYKAYIESMGLDSLLDTEAADRYSGMPNLNEDLSVASKHYPTNLIWDIGPGLRKTPLPDLNVRLNVDAKELAYWQGDEGGEEYEAPPDLAVRLGDPDAPPGKGFPNALRGDATAVNKMKKEELLTIVTRYINDPSLAALPIPRGAPPLPIEKKMYDSFTEDELRKLCRERSLSEKGSRDVLKDRLIQKDTITSYNSQALRTLIFEVEGLQGTPSWGI